MKNNFNQKLLAAAVALSFSLGMGAAHADTTTAITFNSNVFGYDSTFGHAVTDAAPFLDHWTFQAVTPMTGTGGASVISGWNNLFTNNVDLASIQLIDTTTSLPVPVTALAPSLGGVFAATSWNVNLVNGHNYDFQVAGMLAPENLTGSYSGNLHISPIPEPETYAMLLIGLGIVGFSARRRKVA
jgi:hypothetical protein